MRLREGSDSEVIGVGLARRRVFVADIDEYYREPIEGGAITAHGKCVDEWMDRLMDKWTSGAMDMDGGMHQGWTRIDKRHQKATWFAA